MDALPTSPEDRKALVARHEPSRAACDYLYRRLVRALPLARRLTAAERLELLRGTEIVADDYDEQVIDDYALHMELTEDETFLTRMLAEGFAEKGSLDERLLFALTEARFSVYEIVRVVPGLGVELHDLLRDCRTCLVDTGEWPDALGPGHHFMCRVMDVDGITMMAFAGLPISRTMATEIAGSLRKKTNLESHAREPRWMSQALMEVMMRLKASVLGKKEPVRSEKIGRNDPCRCGSGKKYKRCCGLLN